ncbi:CHAT domain-containing protein, partial [Psychroserpens sp.]|uniref:CHAT domain-containing protein n=1 Tax=Psychroserpens sp. TaxID=2020870 RepID=UPI003C725FD3
LEFKKIIIVPDIPIYYLPFETLNFNNGYLVNEKSIRYSSHLRFAFFNKRKEGNGITQMTIFAPSYYTNQTANNSRGNDVFLKGAQEEAKILETLFSSNLFTGDKATKENFIAHKSQGDILHLAMHASLDENETGFSHFKFANGEKLFLEELYALKIPADLAVLSACNTAMGEEDGALGIASLQRAFNYAGTSATIASMWEVPDEATSEIMISFYKYLKKGKLKSMALQQAKLDYLDKVDNLKLKHPYYWSGFVLYGQDNSVFTPKNTTNTLYIIFASILLVLIGILIYRKTTK